MARPKAPTPSKSKATQGKTATKRGGGMEMGIGDFEQEQFEDNARSSPQKGDKSAAKGGKAPAMGDRAIAKTGGDATTDMAKAGSPAMPAPKPPKPNPRRCKVPTDRRRTASRKRAPSSAVATTTMALLAAAFLRVQLQP